MKKGALGLAALVVLSAMPAAGQEPSATAREEIDLNIADRRITEEDFEASTAVEIRTGRSEEEGIALRVGALVGARRIDVRLRNVRAQGRFYASLERVQRVLDAYRSDTAAP